jgi:hypothetical protein
MYPQATVELAKLSSGLQILDRENAEICEVSIASVRHWRRGSRRRPGQGGRSDVPRCPRCHACALQERAYSYLLGLYLGDGHIIRGSRDVCAARRVRRATVLTAGRSSAEILTARQA